MEPCAHCGRVVENPCPPEANSALCPNPRVIVTNTPRPGETPEQTAARFDRAPLPAAAPRHPDEFGYSSSGYNEAIAKVAPPGLTSDELVAIHARLSAVGVPSAPAMEAHAAPAVVEAPVVPASDPVVRPNHYARFKIEPIEFIMENDLPFWLGNVIKYSMRYDAKNGVEDLRKAERYLEMRRKQLEGDKDFAK